MRNIKNGLIMKITGFIAISFSIVCSTAACSDDPVAVANPEPAVTVVKLSLIHISEPTRLGMISYAVFCLKK